MQPVSLPGGRDVRAVLDRPADTPAEMTADARRPLVVACPPHPQHGGSRRDPLLRAVGEALTERGIDCLRFDYGSWTKGRGECRDAATAVEWAADRTDCVGLFGYSFGGAVALSVAADRTDTADLAGCSVVAPAAALPTSEMSADAFDQLGCPAQIVYGTRDTTVDWEPTVERARQCGVTVVDFETDHSFVGYRTQVTESVGDFFARALQQ